MSSLLEKFWSWYNRHALLTSGLTAGLFALQLVHLYWLTTHVVAHRAFGVILFDPSPLLELLIIIVDYTEIPAIVATSIFYVNTFRQGKTFKPLLYLFLLNTQWIHIFWITDEVVVEQLAGAAPVALPVWLSWLAIGIDYLELPVIYDTIKEFFMRLLKKPNPT